MNKMKINQSLGKILITVCCVLPNHSHLGDQWLRLWVWEKYYTKIYVIVVVNERF